MDKRKSSGSDSSAPKKKLKWDSTKQRSAQSTKIAGKKISNKDSSRNCRANQVPSAKRVLKNFWWHSKKAKKTKSKGNSGSVMAKALRVERAAKSVQASTGVSNNGEHVKISTKKALQLKKKRQRKNRQQQRKMNSGKDSAGDILREPKTWETYKGVNGATKKPGVGETQNQERQERTKVKKSQPEHQSSKKTVKFSESKDPMEGPAKTAVSAQGSSQSLGLQKSGGQKKNKKKKAKKFKKMKNADRAVSAPGQDSSSSMKKARNAKETVENDSIKVKNARSNRTATDLGRKEDVSSNWKALLPTVEMLKETDAKRHRKYGKGGKRNEQAKESKPEIWFDDVDPSLIKANENAEVDDKVQSETDYNPLIRKDAQDCLTKCLAMDCEMVGTGPKGSQSALARVSVVNQFGACVFDKYVTPREPVTDYRTFVSGIRPQDLRDKGEDFEKVQKELSDLLKGRVVVGHALHNDFKVLYFSHPRSLIRDTSAYQPFKELFKSKRPGLKKLTELLLKVKVQKGEHNSVEDAQAAMKLYMLHRKQWEKSLREKTHRPSTKKTLKMTKKSATDVMI